MDISSSEQVFNHLLYNKVKGYNFLHETSPSFQTNKYFFLAYDIKMVIYQDHDVYMKYWNRYEFSFKV